MNRLRLFFTIILATLAGASAQEWAKARLDKSPRHLEWVKIKHGDREVNSFIAFPEVKEKATTVIVIHEIFGLTDWARGVADQLAEAGYIAIAPDFLSGAAPGGGDGARKAVSSLPADQITADLKAAVAYATQLPASNGKVVVGGFCWGGSQAFRFATNNQDIKAAFVFYGSGLDQDDDLARITCPVYGFYGGSDARVTSTVPKTMDQMKKAEKTYEPVTYDGAGHGFMRTGDDPATTREADKKARDEAWKRWKTLLGK